MAFVPAPRLPVACPVGPESLLYAIVKDASSMCSGSERCDVPRILAMYRSIFASPPYRFPLTHRPFWMHPLDPLWLSLGDGVSVEDELLIGNERFVTFLLLPPSFPSVEQGQGV